MIQARSGFAPWISALRQYFGGQPAVAAPPATAASAPAAAGSEDVAGTGDGYRRLAGDLRLFAITFAAGFLFFSAWLA